MNRKIEAPKPTISVVIPTFRPGDIEFDALKQLVKLSLTIKQIYQIIVVNDSADALPANYRKLFEENSSLVDLVEYGENWGRARARNNGAHRAKADVLWFLDSDCFCEENEALLIPGFDWDQHQVHYGQIKNLASKGFWARYQQSRRQSENTNSSANLLVKKSVFEAIGGYYEGYTKYGFEDRDLYERLRRAANIQNHSTFFVHHEGVVDFNSSRNKIFESATSGRVFSERYPEQYSVTLYGKVDARYVEQPVRFFLNIISTVDRILFPVTRFAVESLPLPFLIKSLIVKTSFACTYFRGSKKLV